MNGVFSRQIAQAQRQIAAKGEQCQYAIAGASIVGDPAKPWMKSNTAPQVETVPILFMSSSGDTLLKLIAGSDREASTQKGIMPSVSFTPKPDDVVTRTDGTKLVIDDVDKLSPNGEVIIWWLKFKR